MNKIKVRALILLFGILGVLLGIFTWDIFWGGELPRLSFPAILDWITIIVWSFLIFIVSPALIIISLLANENTINKIIFILRNFGMGINKP